ncbi:unnamed protein product [Paramecium sonneborni]|uniref:HMG box domain-containing protein n=1 Tax=Paramecium sonneborni TaxID=65129 RepID=A0A8S1KEX6_9CILI|nr:unnamed protein product [Paramecium sonneborni]
MKSYLNKQYSTKISDGFIPKIPFISYYDKVPILSAYYLYIEEERWKAVRDQSDLTIHEIAKQAYNNWHQHLTEEQKNVFQEKAKQIKSESDAKEYMKMLEQTYTSKKKIKKIKQKPQPKKKIKT